MKKTVITTAIIVIVISAGLMVFVNLTSRKTNEFLNYFEAQRGPFEISVSGTGELVAQKYTDVEGPRIINYFNIRAAALKITDLVPEGTFVKKGDYVATFDRSGFSNNLKDEQTKLNNLESQFELKLIDTAVVLTTLRDDIKDQKYSVEESAIDVDQSLFDPPAVQRQIKMKYEMSLRILEQKQRIYLFRLAQASSETRTMKLNLEIQKRKVKEISEVLANFVVRAPSDGLIMYKKDMLGNKIKSGSVISPFNPIVATIPDLSSLESRFHISEIDINKVSTGMPVTVSVDAVPGKTFEGRVTSISNIGEQLPNSETKVFEVFISLEQGSSTLKPAMTTGNKIITRRFDEVVYVPLEALHTGSDNLTFVYTRDGYRQVVIPGESNDKYVIIERGIDAGRPLYLEPPVKAENYKIAGNELIPLIFDKKEAQLSVGKGGNSEQGITEMDSEN